MTEHGIDKKELAMVIAASALVILMISQAALNYSVLAGFDWDADENQDLRRQIVQDNNTHFSQLIAGAFVFLGIGSAVVAAKVMNRKDA